MVQTKRNSSANLANMQSDKDGRSPIREASCLFALMTSKRPVSRRNRASWYLRQLNRVVTTEVKRSSPDDNAEPDRNLGHVNPLDREYNHNLTEDSENEEVPKMIGDKSSDSNKSLLDDKHSPRNIDSAELVHKDIHLISITSNRFCNQYQNESPNSANLNNDTHVNSNHELDGNEIKGQPQSDNYLVTPQTRVLYLSKSIASSIILDLSPSIVSVSSQSNCVYSDIMFEALKDTLSLLVRSHEIPTSSTNMQPYILQPKIYVSVIAYSPFLVAKSNQILVQNRRVTSTNIDQVLAELWLSLDRLFNEIKDLISNSSGPNLIHGSLDATSSISANTSMLQPHITPDNMLRHPSEVLDDILELGIFSTSLLPKLSRRSVVIISDGLFAYTNNLAIHRVKNIALSFVSLSDENTYPDACFGYTPSVDLMKFIAMSTQGFHITFQKLNQFYKELNNNKTTQEALISSDNQGRYDHHERKQRSRSTIERCQTLKFLSNPLYKLFCWTLHCNTKSSELHPLLSESSTSHNGCYSEQSIEPIRITPDQIGRFFCADRSVEHGNQTSHHDWRVFRHLKRNLDADFEQVLSCLLREGYLIKSIQFKHKDVSKIVARLVLHWRHNLDLERELTAPYWINVDPFGHDNIDNAQLKKQTNNRKPSVNTLVYGNTYTELLVHGSYSFLLNLFSDKNRRRSEYRDLTYKQFKQLIEGVMFTHDRLQYLSRYYKDGNVSIVPSFLLHGNSLLYEQPHTHKLSLMVENVAEEPRTSEFQEYWQKLSYIDTKGWKNMMHIHTIRLVLEHDQPKFKNIHYQNTNGRYTHVQCRRAMSTLSNFIKSYVSFALVEDSTYIKFITHQTNKLANQDDLSEVENSATKGFVVIKVNKSLPIVIMKLMFTSGIPDSRRIEIVSKLEDQLINLKLRSAPTQPTKLITNTTTTTNASKLGRNSTVVAKSPPSTKTSTSSLDTNSNTVNQQNQKQHRESVVNIIKTRTIAASSDTCCMIIKSPLETMLRIYHRNFTTDFLLNNWAHGLPGSCQISLTPGSRQQGSIGGLQQQQHRGLIAPGQQHQKELGVEQTTTTASGNDDQNQPQDFGFGNRFNLVFGKYLAGFRVVLTIKDLPHDVVNSLAANVLGRICAIMVNCRIRQGFRIAFNNSGILNLVAELIMEDRQFQINDKANCLTQYVLFPPTITNPLFSQLQLVTNMSNNATTITASGPGATTNSTNPISSTTTNHPASSKPSSLSGSFNINNSGDSYMNKYGATNTNKNSADSFQDGYRANATAACSAFIVNNTSNNNNPQQQAEVPDCSSDGDGEIKFIREYWIEQQYGISATNSQVYHDSLSGKRFPEVVDHLYATDKLMFDCLLTYDVLQLLSDKTSPYYTLDEYFYHGATAHNNNQNNKSPSSNRLNSSIQNSPCNINNNKTTIARSKPPADDQNIKPSCIIEGRFKSDSLPTANLLDCDTFASRIPLIETEFAFCLTNFLDYCQMASVNMLLFQDKSEFYVPQQDNPLSNNNSNDHEQQHITSGGYEPAQPCETGHRKMMQTDINYQHRHHQHHPIPLTRNDTVPNMISEERQQLSTSKREHRYSYQSSMETPSTMNFSTTSGQPINVNNVTAHYASLNQLFLETVQKRLKQIHEKELKLPMVDKIRLASYLKERLSKLYSSEINESMGDRDLDANEQDVFELNDDEDGDASVDDDCHIEWRCFLRKGNQDNQMIVLIPSSMRDIMRWLNRVDHHHNDRSAIICPIFIFRCSSSLVNDRLIKSVDTYDHLNRNINDKPTMNETEIKIATLESDLGLHLGQPCVYLNKYHSLNDELINDFGPTTTSNNLITGNLSSSNQALETKLMENLHFKAFLRKIKNTVLKSRFSSLSDAYSGELFIHKDDICYYMENIDAELQKKYHVSSNLKYVLDFMQIYSNYRSSLPKEPVKPVNPLLTSILLQKCGIYTNLPVARFNESDPLMQQLHDKKLVLFMKCNYNIELPVLTETLSSSTILRDLIRSQQFSILTHPNNNNSGSNASGTLNNYLASLPNNNSPATAAAGSATTGSGVGGVHHSISTSYQQQRQLIYGGNSVGSSSPSGSYYMERLRRVQQLQHQASKHQSSTTNISSVNQASSFNSSGLPVGPIDDLLILEAFRGQKICPMRDVPDLEALSGDANIAVRQELHMAEVIRRNALRKESQQYRRVLKSKASYSQSHSVIDQALKKVDKLGRLEHFCLTPLLFSPAWRSKLAPVRDHTIESSRVEQNQDGCVSGARHRYSSYDNTIQGCCEVASSVGLNKDDVNITPGSSYSSSTTAGGNHHLQMMMQQKQDQQEIDERWHQIVCNNYLKEYEQYIQTLGFNSIQVRYQQQHHQNVTTTTIKTTSNMTPESPSGHTNRTSSSSASQRGGSISGRKRSSSSQHNHHNHHHQHRKHSTSTSGHTSGDQNNSTNITPNKNMTNVTSANFSVAGGGLSSVHSSSTGPAYNTGYLIKFLNSGCLVFKVGFCKPYVYSLLYSIEGERFNNCQGTKSNMLAFLDELDNTKLTMHLHSFTYDYHLRTIYSYISGRQLSLLSPNYHLISFLDEFLKYYQKAPNYARNHILCDEIHIGQLKVSGQQLYKYLIDHNKTYKFEVAEMSQNSIILQHNSGSSQNSAGKVCSTLSRSSAVPESEVIEQLEQNSTMTNNNPNDHVLIELKREKIRHLDATKEPHLFDCGLLVTQNNDQPTLIDGSSSLDFDESSTLKLKYFLLLSNQRDLYPKLVHTHDTMSVLKNFGCHRPIRMGTNREQQSNRTRETTLNSTNNKTGGNLSQSNSTLSLGSRQLDTQASCEPDELFVSGELLLSTSPDISGPPSVDFTATTTAAATDVVSRQEALRKSKAPQSTNNNQLVDDEIPSSSIISNGDVERVDTYDSPPKASSNRHSGKRRQESVDSVKQRKSSNEPADPSKENQQPSGTTTATSDTDTNAINSVTNLGTADRTICDEEITYLGYFSTDEMDMLRFLQEKAANLRSHMEKIVRYAEVHYRRDFLWNKLMLDGGPFNHVKQQIQYQGNNHSTINTPGNSLTSANIAASQLSFNHLNTGSTQSMMNNNRYNQSQSRNTNNSLTPAATPGYYSPGSLVHNHNQHQQSSGSSNLSRTNTNQSESSYVTTSTLPIPPPPTWVNSYLTNDLCLTSDDLIQLLSIVEIIDLSHLDPQLSPFVAMHINWYKKLLRSFYDLKQSAMNQHRIHIVVHQPTSKVLLFYMDPRCLQAFVLISIDSGRGSAEMSLLLRDRNDISMTNNITKKAIAGKNPSLSSIQKPESISGPVTGDASSSITTSTTTTNETTHFEPLNHPDCKRLIEDFVNFCATFMWSTFLQ